MPHRPLVAFFGLALVASAASAQSTPGAAADEPLPGRAPYLTYCAPCHGPEGAGLVGPNLTDAEVLHGESVEDIIQVIANGIPGKAMPAWDAVMTSAEIADTAAYVKSIMGNNLPSPAALGESTVTPFPGGTRAWPLVLRTFMPTMGLGEDIFPHHGIGQSTPKYRPNTGRFSSEELDHPIAGIPAAIAVNFGEDLSYCFDTTECRLLYAWHGPFMDMTHYWGAETGAARKRFDYVPTVMGELTFKARGRPPLTGTPRFRGYGKVDGVPVMRFSIDDKAVTLRIEPGNKPGEAVCHYTVTNAPGGIVLRLPEAQAAAASVSTGEFINGELYLDAVTARQFTLTLRPEVMP